MLLVSKLISTAVSFQKEGGLTFHLSNMTEVMCSIK